MVLASLKPRLLFDDPVTAYAELTKDLVSGVDRYVQDFDYSIKELPGAVGKKPLEDVLPLSPVLPDDNDLDSWEPSQGSLGICGSVASVCGYAAVPRNLPIALENGIYPTERSPFGLYLVRVVDPNNPSAFKWLAIDSVVPVDSQGKLLFSWTANGQPMAQTLLLKAMATMCGGCFDELTNSRTFKQSFPGWFPYINESISTFDVLKASLDKGAICIVTFAQQYDATGFKITPPGIIYGHAFAVCDYLEVEGHQAIRIENPHGKNARDFPTDYSDDSGFWTQHPELAHKLADAKQGGGNWWMGFDQLISMVNGNSISARVFTGQGI